MAKVNTPGNEELIELIRNLEGVVMAGGIQANPLEIFAACSCQNCGCNTRHGAGCGCKPKCTCQGHTAKTSQIAMDMLLGAASQLSMKEIKTLADLRDKIVPVEKA